MRKWMLIGVASACLTAWLAGCGGGGGGCGTVNTEELARAAYAGHWVGTWKDVGNSQDGTLDLKITSDGGITGTAANKTLGVEGSAPGSIDGYGTMEIDCHYPATVRTCLGKVALGTDHRLTGTLTEYEYKAQYGKAAVDLTRQ